MDVIIPAPPWAGQLNQADILWRFLTMDKTLSMLETGTLWFARTDTFEDPFEGVTPSAWQTEWNANIGAQLPHLPESVMQTTFASCWYRGEHEPAGMWREYGSDSCAICIQTNPDVFRQVLTQSDTDIGTESVLLGAVRYLDFQTEHPGFSAQPGNAQAHARHYWAHFLKRRNFSHEQEVRATFFHLPHGSAPHPQQPHGVPVTVHLDHLIRRVVVSPYSMPTSVRAVERLFRAYNISAPVERSQLFDLP